MTYQLIKGSAHHLPTIASRSVQAIITSPPYFGLRAYSGEQSILWPTVEYAPMPGLAALRIQGCEPGCEHEWGNQLPCHHPGQVEQTKWKTAQAAGHGQTAASGAYCTRCSGWRGGLGLEVNIESYIGHLILCLREWRRILRDDGLVFCNLGDSYAGSWGNSGSRKGLQRERTSEHYERNGYTEYTDRPPSSYKQSVAPKNLMMIPARFALAAQADGWYLRSAMPWLKRNGMPESATDRPSQVVESVFMLSKSERYYFDMEAVKQNPGEIYTRKGTAKGHKLTQQEGYKGIAGGTLKRDPDEAYGFARDITTVGRHLRSSDLFFKTWQGLLSTDDGDPMAVVINPQPFSAAHFAVFPPLLPEVCILAATSAKGACPKCGAAWKRVVERTEQPDETAKGSRFDKGKTGVNGNGRVQEGERFVKVSTGWAPSCACDAGVWKLRDDLTPEQRAYVISRIG